MPIGREYCVNHPHMWHYLPMINDGWRNKFYHDALATHAKDKVVLDVGTGTGILAFYALAAGAKFVYAFDTNADSANLARRVLSSCFDESRFKVLNEDFFSDRITKTVIDQPVDIVMAELIGPGLFDQGQINIWHCAKPFLAPGAISIPQSIGSDLWIWYNNFGIMDGAVFQSSTPKLYVDECLDLNFAQALINIDQTDYAPDKLARFSPVPDTMEWLSVNQVSIQPDEIRLDVLHYSMDQMPYLEQSPLRSHTDVTPHISFEFELDRPGTVAVVHKLHFESQTIFIKDARYTPWQQNPSQVIEHAGRYKITYNNIGLDNWLDHRWICNPVS